MRFARRLFKWLFVSLAVVVLLAAILPWTTVVRERLSAGPFKDYLAKHVQRLDLEEEDPGFDFPAAFYDHQLFLVGEIHGAQAAHGFDLALIKHLNQKSGVRWLMAELSFVQAERFNKYLDTGDETFITPVFSSWLSAAVQWGNQQHYEKIKALREYNLTLPESRRVRFFGVDLISERDRVDAANWLSEMLETLSVSAATELFELRDAAGRFDPDTFRDVAEAALPVLTSGDQADGIDSASVAYLVRNLLLSLEGAGRYDAIPANIEAMVNDFGIGDDEPLYGFWGLFHVMKAVINETAQPLAMRIPPSFHSMKMVRHTLAIPG